MPENTQATVILQQVAADDSKAALKTIGYTVAASIGGAAAAAAAEVVQTNAPGIAAAVSSLLPPWAQALAAPFIAVVFGTVVAFLGKLAKKQHETAVNSALMVTPPDGVDALYHKP